MKRNSHSKKRLQRATIIYWLLLIYIVAALVWWFISLERQNREMKDLKIKAASEQLSEIEKEYERSSIKYISEGAIFLLLSLVGAGFVYRSVRRQFRMQQQQQNFMMAVTHELKTPIAVARLNLETMQKYQLDTEKQKKLIRMTIEETDRLNTLTNNILILSQLEGGGYKTEKEDLDLSGLFKDCLQNFVNRFPDRKFSSSIQDDIEIKGDALLLQLLINNLIDNAIKYSPREKPIFCRLEGGSNKIELNVIDEGAGIPAEEKKKVFDKFYRIGSESTRKTQGTGLGLYLCKKIAEYHNADIIVTNNEGGGSNFAVIFRQTI